jgi:hypothetical protein
MASPTSLDFSEIRTALDPIEDNQEIFESMTKKLSDDEKKVLGIALYALKNTNAKPEAFEGITQKQIHLLAQHIQQVTERPLCIKSIYGAITALKEKAKDNSKAIANLVQNLTAQERKTLLVASVLINDENPYNLSYELIEKELSDKKADALLAKIANPKYSERKVPTLGKLFDQLHRIFFKTTAPSKKGHKMQ